ncbi:serine/threonine protein kinase [Kitasatospora sp. NBC_01287]|uniref:serine/threonine-protein kinase n=1 Tax=Kitasatospora sp. NBC_01287 TaxID=2903573 RepID=UPI0022589B3A|nr:serine/threonine-protein kinase [Kitasatospora sp. NBC_01287]MCX4744853.1 serine/threonine protein kinase [Kitasatospora sp. NBC_01287]
MQEDRVGGLIAGRYRLTAKLGAGGFGEVWEAHDETLGVNVAVKAVRVPPAASVEEQAERLARAAREARNAARLRDHPNVVAVHDVVIDGGLPWTVMQLVAGTSLQEHLDAQGPLPVGRAVALASAMLSALGAAHDAGIVHRDVKPANVMLAGDRILLTDFGIAVHQQDTALTGTGMLIGSAEYMAPERARGQDALPASDLFSLGVMLYQAVEGFSPFRRGTFEASLAAVLFESPSPPQRAGGLADLITQLMAKSPDQRPTVAQARELVRSTMLGRSRKPTFDGSDGQGGLPHAGTHRRERLSEALAAAEQTARCLVDVDESAWVLAQVAQFVSITDPDRARHLAAEAENLIRSSPPASGFGEPAVLAGVASSLAGTDPDRARHLADEAEHLARGLLGEADRAPALALVARSLARVDPERARRLVDDAERLVLPDTDAWAVALNWAADAMAVIDPGRAQQLRVAAIHTEAVPPSPGEAKVSLAASPSSEAERAARATSDRVERVKALAEVAGQWVEADPDRAELLMAEAERTAQRILTRSTRSWARSEMGKAWARTARKLAFRDPDRACAWADRTRRLAQDIPDGTWKNVVLTETAGALAWIAFAVASADPDKAVSLVAEVRGVARTVPDGEWKHMAVTHEVSALSWVAGSLGGHDLDRALQLMEEAKTTISRELPHDRRDIPRRDVVRDLAEIARRQVPVDLDRALAVVSQAQLLAQEISHDTWKTPALDAVVRVLADVAKLLAISDPVRAQQTANRALRALRGLPQDAASGSMGRVVEAMARIGEQQERTDPGLGATLLADAERLTRDITDDSDRAFAWTEIARAWANVEEGH